MHGGGFGDVWRGEVGGHAIAIKVMRVFDASGVETILKVFYLHSFPTHDVTLA